MRDNRTVDLPFCHFESFAPRHSERVLSTADPLSRRVAWGDRGGKNLVVWRRTNAVKNRTDGIRAARQGILFGDMLAVARYTTSSSRNAGAFTMLDGGHRGFPIAEAE